MQHRRHDGTGGVVDDLIGDADLRLAILPDPLPLAAVDQGSGV